MTEGCIMNEGKSVKLDKTKNTVANLAWATHSENTTAYFDSKKQEQLESEVRQADEEIL